MGISSQTLAEHFFCLVQTLLCLTQLAELDVSKRTVWSDQEQLIQIRFRGQGIALIHSSCCMIQIALCGARSDGLELISDGFELSPVSVLQSIDAERPPRFRDRKSTRLNSSHGYISYAVFCLKKKRSHRRLHVPSR